MEADQELAQSFESSPAPARFQLPLKQSVSISIAVVILLLITGVHLLFRSRPSLNNEMPLPGSQTATPANRDNHSSFGAIPTNAKSASPGFVAIIEREISDTIQDTVHIYSLKENRFQTNSFLQQTTGIIQIGDFSPSGTLLPVLVSSSQGRNGVLYFYDTQTQTAEKIVAINENNLLESNQSLFSVFATWIDEDSLIYNSSGLAPNTLITVSRNGAVDTRSRPDILYKNLDMKVIYHVDTVKTTFLEKKEKVVSLPFKEERVVGAINNTIVTLHIHGFHNPYTGSKEEHESTYLQTYDTKGSSLAYIEFPNNNWLTTSALIRPNYQTLIIRQQQQEETQQTRFLEIAPTTPYNPTTILETISTDASQRSPGEASENFLLSADGQWLIFYQPTDRETSSFPGDGVIAYNLSTHEKINLCTKNCVSVRTYNPHRLDLQ